MKSELIMIPAPWSAPKIGDIPIIRKLRRSQKNGICCRRTKTLGAAYSTALYLHLSGEDECDKILQSVATCEFCGNQDQWFFVECSLALMCRRARQNDSEGAATILHRIREVGFVEGRLSGSMFNILQTNIRAAAKIGSKDREMAWRESFCAELIFILEMGPKSIAREAVEALYSENVEALRILAGVECRGRA